MVIDFAFGRNGHQNKVAQMMNTTCTHQTHRVLLHTPPSPFVGLPLFRISAECLLRPVSCRMPIVSSLLLSSSSIVLNISCSDYQKCYKVHQCRNMKLVYILNCGLKHQVRRVVMGDISATASGLNGI